MKRKKLTIDDTALEIAACWSAEDFGAMISLVLHDIKTCGTNEYKDFVKELKKAIKENE